MKAKLLTEINQAKVEAVNKFLAWLLPYIAFDAQKNELYVQINAHNYSDSNIDIYLLCENKKIIEVPFVLENGFFKGRLTDVPDGDFRIYIDED